MEGDVDAIDKAVRDTADRHKEENAVVGASVKEAGGKAEDGGRDHPAAEEPAKVNGDIRHGNITIVCPP